MPEEYNDNGEKKHWYDGIQGAFEKVWNHRAIAKRNEFATLSAAFCHKQKRALIILADPETDVIFVAYDDQHSINRITDIAGKSMRVVKKAVGGNQESIMNLLSYISAAINANHEAILKRSEKKGGIVFQKDSNAPKFKNYEQLRKANEMVRIEKSRKKREREAEMAKIRQEQEKTDIETGNKEVSGVDRLRDLFRRKITK